MPVEGRHERPDTRHSKRWRAAIDYQSIRNGDSQQRRCYGCSRYATARAGRKGSLEKKVSEGNLDYPGKEANALWRLPRRCSATKRNIQARTAVCCSWPGEQSIGTCSVEAVPAVS